MRTKLLILFLLLSQIVNIFFSCVCDVITKYESYSHKTLHLKNLDNSGEEAIETESLQINKNAYGIRLILTIEIDAITHTRQIGSPLIQSANATSFECPPEFAYVPTDSIVSIKIFTVNHFDNQHPENSDITEYFRVFPSYSTVHNYVSNMFFTYNDDFELRQSRKKNLEIDFLLMESPKINDFHQFKVQIKLSDGYILEEQTTEIELL